MEPAILILLARGPAHGYSLARDAADLVGGGICVDHGGVYRALRRLEEEGAVSSSWSETSSGPNRREYRITLAGLELLTAWAVHLRDRSRVFEALAELAESAQAGAPATGKEPEDDSR